MPGQPGYTPLRTVHLVSWLPDATPHLLRSADQVTAAHAAGQVQIEQPVVVNMPVTRWPGGHR